jgi:hypothetical protein
MPADGSALAEARTRHIGTAFYGGMNASPCACSMSAPAWNRGGDPMQALVRPTPFRWIRVFSIEGRNENKRKTTMAFDRKPKRVNFPFLLTLVS